MGTEDADDGAGAGTDEGAENGRTRPWVTLRREHEHPILGAYERWIDGSTHKSVYVHQLVAIAEGADPHEIFDRSNPVVVTHANGRRDDNRPANIVVQRRPWRSKAVLMRSLAAVSTLRELADQWETRPETISEWMDRHEITRSWEPGTGWVVRDEASDSDNDNTSNDGAN